jgi:hypothetical protein
MGQGRKAIPDEIKRLRGTLRKDRVNKNQPKIGGILFPNSGAISRNLFLASFFSLINGLTFPFTISPCALILTQYLL